MFDQLWNKKTAIVAIWTLFITLFALSGPFGQSFLTIFSSLLIIPVGIVTYFILSSKTPEPSEEFNELQRQFDEQQAIILEQEEVIAEYERIFDSQIVEIPCVCGKNTFKSLFSPNSENIIECDECKSKYKITINHNSTLMSEPLDERIVIDQLTSV